MEARKANHWSPEFLASILSLLTVVGLAAGLWIVYNASYPYSQTVFGNPFAIFFRQVKYAIFGIALFFLALLTPSRFLKGFGWSFHLVSVILLVATLFFGKKVGEAQRWLSIGSVQFQPSEFAKITMVVCIAFLSAQWKGSATLKQKFWVWLALFVCWSLTTALVLVQPHLSGGFLLALIGLATMFFARLPIPLILATLLLFGGIGYITQEQFLRPYQRERWQSGNWLTLAGEQKEKQKAYQVRQALLGLQVGGWFGQGPNRGKQKHLFLPAAHTDFVFAVIGEEFGFLGSFLVLAFFVFLAYFSLCLASQAPEPFSAGLAGGIAFSLWMQAILHISVNANLLPPTGFPLPFASAGGSSLCATLWGMGLLLNVSLSLFRKAKRRGGAKDALGDGGWRDWGTHLPSPSHSRRRQVYFA